MPTHLTTATHGFGKWLQVSQLPTERRHLATDAEFEEALDALDRLPHRVPANAWPADLEDLDVAGLYSWWVDGIGACDLASGLGHAFRSGRIYAGQAGATKWPTGQSVTATLRARLGRAHLRGNIRGSTFRLTLAAALRTSLDLTPVGRRRLTKDSECRLSGWIADHLEVAIHPFVDPDPLNDLEHRVLRTLDPPLNLEGMAPTPLRATLSAKRATLSGSGGSPTSQAFVTASPPRPRPPGAPADLAAINQFIQDGLRRRSLHDAPAVVVANWLDEAGLLADSPHHPGLPLRTHLRAGLIDGAEQRPPQSNGRWFVVQLRG